MTEPSKYNINKTEVFQVVEKNDGTVVGKQVSEIHKNNIDPALQSALQDLKNTLAELGQQHPNIATESEAIEIIDGEITNPFPSPTASKLALLRKQFLNPERHFQATKATLIEMTKHFLSENIFAQGFITYIDTLSSDPGQGA
ncbi:MAG TPA: hypothetical protein IGS17_14305 [Oscillatoriales cyanobacterium M59_W2019_021]|nr:MAG: hypothetical protein D6728_15405 [Cyanobacteria bacterium J055]HIK30655.1 hypothetical protein [Oscillatoriales cyanobacterium M4454_W2019_049]HIK52075.1 hypothetical protein [Oscillatoriales cyanobacterium M59_W2019_021]